MRPFSILSQITHSHSFKNSTCSQNKRFYFFSFSGILFFPVSLRSCMRHGNRLFNFHFFLVHCCLNLLLCAVQLVLHAFCVQHWKTLKWLWTFTAERVKKLCWTIRKPNQPKASRSRFCWTSIVLFLIVVIFGIWSKWTEDILLCSATPSYQLHCTIVPKYLWCNSPCFSIHSTWNNNYSNKFFNYFFLPSFLITYSAGQLLSAPDEQCIQYTTTFSDTIAAQRFPFAQCDSSAHIKCQWRSIVYDRIWFAATQIEETTQTEARNGCEATQ